MAGEEGPVLFEPREIKMENPDEDMIRQDNVMTGTVDSIIAEVIAGPPIELRHVPKKTRKMSSGATATVTVKESPLSLGQLMGTSRASTSRGLNKVEDETITHGSDSNVGMDALTCAMTCNRCAAPMRTVMRRHRTQGQLVQFPALRCTRKGCQTFKSLRAISGEVIPRTPVPDPERSPWSEAKACISTWRIMGTANDDQIHEAMGDIRRKWEEEKRKAQFRIDIANEMEEWLTTLPPTKTKNTKKDKDDVEVMTSTGGTSLRVRKSGRFGADHMGGRNMAEFISHLLGFDEECNIIEDYPREMVGKEERMPSSEEIEEGFASDDSQSLDDEVDSFLQKTDNSTLLSVGVCDDLMDSSPQSSPLDAAGAVLRSLLNQKKAVQYKKKKDLERALLQTIRTVQNKKLETILAKSSEVIEQNGEAAMIKAKRSKTDAVMPGSNTKEPRPYNSLSKALALSRKRSAATEDGEEPPPVHFWRKRDDGKWANCVLRSETDVIVDEETRIRLHRERLDREERIYRRQTLPDDHEAMKQEAMMRKEQMERSDQEKYYDWIFEERARMAQLGDLERDIDEQEMLKEDLDGPTTKGVTPRKRSAKRTEMDKKLKMLQDRKKWMEERLNRRRREMAKVKIEMDEYDNGSGPQEKDNEVELNVRQILTRMKDSMREDEYPSGTSSSDTVASILEKIKNMDKASV